MNFWDFANASANRRHQIRLRKLEKSGPFVTPQLLIALIIILLFGSAFAYNPTDAILIGALIGIVNLAAGYFLGSSAGAAKANDRNDKLTDLVHKTVDAMPGTADVTLKPGETAQAER